MMIAKHQQWQQTNADGLCSLSAIHTVTRSPSDRPVFLPRRWSWEKQPPSRPLLRDTCSLPVRPSQVTAAPKTAWLGTRRSTIPPPCCSNCPPLVEVRYPAYPRRVPQGTYQVYLPLSVAGQLHGRYRSLHAGAHPSRPPAPLSTAGTGLFSQLPEGPIGTKVRPCLEIQGTAAPSRLVVKVATSNLQLHYKTALVFPSSPISIAPPSSSSPLICLLHLWLSCLASPLNRTETKLFSPAGRT